MHNVKCKVHKLSRSILSNLGWVINISEDQCSSSKVTIYFTCNSCKKLYNCKTRGSDSQNEECKKRCRSVSKIQRDSSRNTRT